MQEIKPTSAPMGANKDPSKEDSLKVIHEVKKETGDYRKQFEKDWKEQDDFYYGKQHKTGEHHKTVKNHIFKIIEGEVPILTDSMPGVSVLSDLTERQDDALVLEKSIKHVYNDQNLQLLLPTLVRSSLTSAPGYLYPFYDPDADDGDGKIRFKQLPWDGVFLDGNAQTVEDSSQARIEIPMRNDVVARMFPQKKDEILQTKGGEGAVHNNADSDGLETRDVSGTNTVQAGAPKKHNSKDISKYVETWVKSYDLEDIPQDETIAEIEKENAEMVEGTAPDIKKWENHPAHIQAHEQSKAMLLSQLGLPPETTFDQAAQAVEMMMQNNPEMDASKVLLSLKVVLNHIEEHQALSELNPEGKKPKYKDGWRVIKSFKDVILYDGPNPEQSGEIPLVPFYCYKDQTIYGFSEAKNIISAQKSLNEMDYKEYKGLKRVANPGWLADHESGVTPEKLTNDDGIVVIKAKGTEVRRLEAGQISNQLPARRESDKFDMEDISGIKEVTQGGGNPNLSGIAIQNMQTQAVGRIRLKDRYLQHYSMKRLAKLTAKLIMNNWSTEKRLRLASDSSSVEELIFDPLKMADLSYSVEIAPGSMAGIDKDSLNAFMLSLFDRKIIDAKGLLSVTDFPKREILLKQIDELNEIGVQQQEIEAQMQQLQAENIRLKAMVDPRLLAKEEMKVAEELQRNEVMADINSQPLPEEQMMAQPPQGMM